jgi:O-antigen ligase
LSEKGIFGFIVFIGFLYLILRKLTAFLKAVSDPDEKAYLMCFKAAILVYLISSFVLETSYELQFWLTVGLSMALFTILKKEHPDV